MKKKIQILMWRYYLENKYVRKERKSVLLEGSTIDERL